MNGGESERVTQCYKNMLKANQLARGVIGERVLAERGFFSHGLRVPMLECWRAILAYIALPLSSRSPVIVPLLAVADQHQISSVRASNGNAAR
jgi:hypothetical protein